MEEGYPTNKHPLFKGIKYDYWQERIIAHFESMHIDMWDVVENRDHIPLVEELNEFSRNRWADEQKQRFYLTQKHKMIFYVH